MSQKQNKRDHIITIRFCYYCKKNERKTEKNNNSEKNTRVFFIKFLFRYNHGSINIIDGDNDFVADREFEN